MLISLFIVTSWFDTVNNAVTRWMNFRENHLHEHEHQSYLSAEQYEKSSRPTISLWRLKQPFFMDEGSLSIISAGCGQ